MSMLYGASSGQRQEGVGRWRIAQFGRPSILSRVALGVCACAAFYLAVPRQAAGQQNERDQEIVANLAGGRVIVHVAQDEIIFAAIDQPLEQHSIPPRVMSVDSGHIGVLLGASEWRLPADPKPVRLDRDFPHIASGRNSQYEAAPDAGDPDLETVGVAFLERLRPLVAQLHHKIDFKPDEALFEVVLIGFAPNDYGPEVWSIEYRVEQEEIATHGDYWQTRVLRPRFTQLYPPEKHAPKTLIETRYPPGASKEPTLLQLIQGNDPDIEDLSKGDAKFVKVMEDIDNGRANKAPARDASDFMRAVLPLIAGHSKFILGTMTDHGFNWIVPPEEPVERAQEDKNRPPEAPTLRKRPTPNP